jgi:hypothetical protein
LIWINPALRAAKLAPGNPPPSSSNIRIGPLRAIGRIPPVAAEANDYADIDNLDSVA